MQQSSSSRLTALKLFEPSQAAEEISSIIMVFFGALFVLTVLGFALYLYVASALHTFHLRPVRVAMYILVLMTAMTVGITLIKQSLEGCEAARNLEGNPEVKPVPLASQC
jgi:fumarate reductase subunit D